MPDHITQDWEEALSYVAQHKLLGVNIRAVSVRCSNLPDLKGMGKPMIHKGSAKPGEILVKYAKNNWGNHHYVLGKPHQDRVVTNRTPLQAACALNIGIDRVKYLLSHGNQRNFINNRDSDGVTPLMEACYHGNIEVVKYLLSMGAIPCYARLNERMTMDNSWKFEPVWFTIYSFSRNRIKVLEIILEACRKWAEKYPRDPIERDSATSQNVLEVLLTTEATFLKMLSPECPTRFRVMEEMLKILELFFQSGAQVDESIQVSTPLQLAASRGQPRCSAMLLQHGMNPNTSSPYHNSTALHFAAVQLDFQTTAVLLKYGANIHAITRNDACTPFHRLVATWKTKHPHDSPVATAVKSTFRTELQEVLPTFYSCDSGMSCLEVMLCFGANVDMLNMHGRTPRNGLMDLARMGIDAESYLPETALEYESRLRHDRKPTARKVTSEPEDVFPFKLLPNTGKNVMLCNAAYEHMLGAFHGKADFSKWNPLHIAALFAHATTIGALLRVGFSTSETTDDDLQYTPQQIALAMGRDLIASSLLDLSIEQTTI